MDKLLSEVRKDEKVVVSAKNELIWEDLIKTGINFLNFTVPIYALAFFGQLAMGVSFKTAALTSLAALYGPLRDLASKYVNKDRYIVEKS